MPEVALVIMRGLPASGKTTIATDWVESDPANRIRVNRDQLRLMLHDGVYIKGVTEHTVIAMRDQIINAAFRRGQSVVCDDTNLNPKSMKDLLALAKKNGAKVQVLDLTDVTPEECQRRNIKRKEARQRGVPDAVITDMHKRYIAGKSYPLPVPHFRESVKMEPYVAPLVGDGYYPEAVIFDIDGTLAHMNGRSPYDYSKVSTDTVDDVIRKQVLWYCSEGYRILFVSGRKHECYDDTLNWLVKATGLLYNEDFALFMRKDGDNRNDSIVKYEIFDQYIRPHYRVECVFDDRNRVVEMWRSIGLKCLQVADGNF
jgi:predicted kinase